MVFLRPQVKVCMYDLSHGMMAAMSPQLLGKRGRRAHGQAEVGPCSTWANEYSVGYFSQESRVRFSFETAQDNTSQPDTQPHVPRACAAGRQFEGLWHTSVVVYGMEYFFGGGIQEAPPGYVGRRRSLPGFCCTPTFLIAGLFALSYRTTAAGQPLRTLDYGTTEVPREMFEEYLRSLKDRFNVNVSQGQAQ